MIVLVALLAVLSFPGAVIAQGDWRESNRLGEEAFRAGKIDESIKQFDLAIAAQPRLAPHHWQRGISLYYAGRFDDCRRQFEIHQTVNSEDVENSVWHFLCGSRLTSAADKFDSQARLTSATERRDRQATHSSAPDALRSRQSAARRKRLGVAHRGS